MKPEEIRTDILETAETLAQEVLHHLVDGREEIARALLAAEQRGKDQMARIATDYRYMMEAYEIMLGPKALEVVGMWKSKGVKRFHASWGPDASSMTGEERAQVLLGWEGALNSARLVEDVDSDLSPPQDKP